MRSELERMQRVADQMVSGHSFLRDRYSKYSLIIDVTAIISSFLLVSLSFAPDALLSQVNPFSLPPSEGLKLTSLSVFVLTLVQLRVNWKGRAAQHNDAARNWFRAKSLISESLSDDPIVSTRFELAVAHYNSAGDASVPIPNSLFLKCKSEHLRKVEISKRISEKPYASPAIERVRLWIRDNLRK